MSEIKPRLHFVGIGGIGMSGIAEVFLNQGHPVSGSDIAESETTRRLRHLGAEIFIGHRPENLGQASIVVISSAIRESNPELESARNRRLPVVPRAQMLGELMRNKTGIAVAGTHGKTTTTSLLASILVAAGLDPTLVIGGKVDALGGNAKLGQSHWLVAEADESDGSFLYLPATYAVVTNIDNDHLDHFGTLDAIEDAFVNFVGKLPLHGLAAVCGEDPGVQRCMARWTKPIMTYGFSSEWDCFARDIRSADGISSFNFMTRPKGSSQHIDRGRVRLRIPGNHNVLNALAALTLAERLEIPFDASVRGLEDFKGVRRRFETRYRNASGSLLVIEDYGHHPTEIAATLAAARSTWPSRILTIFQPHRYSRTLHCHDGFLTAFQNTDLLFLTDIYAASEDPIEGVSAAKLAEEVRNHMPAPRTVEHVGDLAAAEERILKIAKEGDLILCLGAGSITRLADSLATQLEKRDHGE